MSEKQRSRFITHLFRVGAYVAAVFWLAFVWGGLKVLSTPDTGRHSHLAGWTILVVAAAVMIATMNHWVKYLQVIFGGGILGGLLATGEGHLLNGSPFPRPVAAAMTALFVGCSLISGTLARHRLRMLDRLALIAFLAAFAGGLVKGTPNSCLIGLGIGFSCLLAAWVHNQLSSTPNRDAGGTARHL